MKSLLKKEGFFDSTFTAQISDSSRNPINIKLRPLEVKLGKIILYSAPVDADIFLFGTDTDKNTPDSLTNLSAGVYEITLKKEGYFDSTFTIEMNDPARITRTIMMRKLEKELGVIILASNPSDADIFLFGTDTGKNTPDSITGLSEGAYEFILRKENFNDSSFTVTLGKNERLTKAIELIPIQEKGNLFIQSNPGGAQIFLDDLFTGKLTPDTLKSIPTGQHVIKLKLEGYIDTSFTVMIEKDVTVTSRVDLQLTPPAGKIVLTSQPGEAQIFLNGNKTGLTTPDSITNLETGTYQITLKLLDYSDTTFNVSLLRNETVFKNIVMNKLLPQGSISLGSNPEGAKIFFNGDDTGLFTPAEIKNLDAGEYLIDLIKEGYIDTTFTVTVQKNRETSIFIELTKEIPKGGIFLNSSPTSAQILFEGEDTGLLTPGVIERLEAGSYSITLKLNEYFDSSFTVFVTKDQISNVFINLRKIPPKGSIFLQSDPEGADIDFEGTNSGLSTPDSITGLESGIYDITLKRTFFRDTTFSVTVFKDQQTSKFVILTDILPPVEITSSYVVSLFGQIEFSFLFNQDVFFEKVEVQKPNSQDVTTFTFGGLIQEGIRIPLSFENFIAGNWIFTFYGNKGGGAQLPFIVIEQVNAVR